jgi:hypothetical protein
MRFDLSLRGDRELAQALASLLPKVQARVLRGAFRRAARPVLQTAKANVLALRITGLATEPLARGLKIVALPARRGRIGVAVQTPTRRELVTASIRRAARRGARLSSTTRLSTAITSTWYYPAHIELGTKRTPAQPYLRGALEQHRAATTAQLRTEILQGIEREARRG